MQQSIRIPVRLGPLLACALALVAVFRVDQAQAHEQNLAPDAAGTQAATPSGIVITLSATDAASGEGTAFTANGAAFAGNPAGSYSPNTLNLGATSFNLTTDGTAAQVAVGAQTPKGTLTIAFSQPVTNPRLHFSRFGGANGSVFNATAWTLTNGRLGTTADMTALGGTAMRVVAGTGGAARLETTSDAPTTACASPASTSGCGTIQVNGTYTILTFDLVLQKRSQTPPSLSTQGADQYGLIVSLDEDFADAPASYGAASHAFGDLALGTGGTPEPNPPIAGVAINTGVTADTATTMYATAAALAVTPLAGAAAATDTDNAFASLNNVNGTAATYAVAVPVSGVSKAAQLCGWIDFNRNAAYETAERSCSTLAANATSGNLTWTLPAGTAYVAGNGYARFRVSYDTTASGQNPTGAANSGEVEDYPIVLLPRVRLDKALSPTTDAGLFNLSISPTVLPAGTAAAANVGNGGTTGFATVGLGASVTIGETAGTGTSLADYATTRTCVNRAGGVVLASASGTSGSFTAMTSASTGANATPATAANSNDTEVVCTLTNTRLGADLSITKTNTPGVNGDVDQAADTVVSGATTTYTVTARNNGPGAANGAIVNDTPASGLTGCAVTGCTATNGAACPAAPSAILTGGASVPAFPSTGTVVFTVQCNVP